MARAPMRIRSCLGGIGLSAQKYIETNPARLISSDTLQSVITDTKRLSEYLTEIEDHAAKTNPNDISNLLAYAKQIQTICLRIRNGESQDPKSIIAQAGLIKILDRIREVVLTARRANQPGVSP